VNVYISLLRYLILCNNVQIRETLMQESRHIVSLLKNFRIYIIVNERKQFLEYPLDVLDLVQVRLYQRRLGHEPLLLFLIPPI
jgi:hypothetical protein